MISLELHANRTKDPAHLHEALAMLKNALTTRRDIDTAHCEFRLVRTGEQTLFVRIKVTTDDPVESIVHALKNIEFDGVSCGLDVVLMPVFYPAGSRKGRWYDPSDPMRATYHTKKGGTRG